MKTIDIECECPNCGHVCKEELNLHVDDLVLDDEELLYHLLYRFNKNRTRKRNDSILIQSEKSRIS